MKTKTFVVCMISVLMLIVVPLTFAQDEQSAAQDEQSAMEEEPTTMADEQTTMEEEATTMADEPTASVPDLRIEDAAICRSVENLEPIGAGDVFSSDQTKLACFSRVVGALEDTEITHNWYYGDTLMAAISLHVGSKSWRTYSTKNILPEQIGEWKVEILAQNGELLKRIIFMIQE